MFWWCGGCCCLLPHPKLNSTLELEQVFFVNYFSLYMFFSFSTSEVVEVIVVVVVAFCYFHTHLLFNPAVFLLLILCSFSLLCFFRFFLSVRYHSAEDDCLFFHLYLWFKSLSEIKLALICQLFFSVIFYYMQAKCKLICFSPSFFEKQKRCAPVPPATLFVHTHTVSVPGDITATDKVVVHWWMANWLPQHNEKITIQCLLFSLFYREDHYYHRLSRGH